MKKILILANNDVGLYKFRKELIQALIDDGNDIYISLPYGKLVDKLIEMGCKFIDTSVDRRGVNPIKDFKLILEYKKIVKQVKPDLILTYTIKPNIYGGLVSRLYKIPYIVNITGLGTAFYSDSMLKKLIVNLYKLSLKKVKYVFFENEGNKQIFKDNKIIDEDICVVMNGAGVNLDEYKFTPLPNSNTIRFIFIGRVMKEKGIEELFNVAKRIKKEYKNVEFDVVGPFEDEYEECVMQLNKNGIINYYGYQEDVRPFIEKSHCLVLPSYHEGMANVLLEAGSMGRCLIATDIHGCKETLVNGKTGFLCRVQDSKSLYNSIKLFIKLSLNEKVEMGLQSRIHVEKYFNKSTIVKETLESIK